MRLKPGVIGDANPHGCEAYRHWLSRTWDSPLPVALVIGINPNTATESIDDGMTNFLTGLLRSLSGEYACGRYVLANCSDYRSSNPKTLQASLSARSPNNMNVIREKLARCDFVVASWGTTWYGQFLEEARREVAALVRGS